MEMQWRTRKKRNLNTEMNVVPYIEVMVVLLVIFMLTTPMLTQGVDVDLPQASAQPVETDDQEPLIISVDREGSFYINVGGDDTVPVEPEVVQTRVASVLSENPEKLVLVRGDKNVSYERVVQLMVLLQEAGAPSVGLVTE